MRLSRLITAVLALPALFGSALAQSAPNLTPRFGISADLTSSTIAADAPTALSRRTAITGGLLVVAPVTPSFAIQSELVYAMKGVALTALAQTNGALRDVKTTIKLNYLENAVLGRYELRTSRRVRPFLYGGPSIAFEARCTVVGEVPGFRLSENCENEGLIIQPRRFDYGVIAGGGLGFDLMGKVATIGARYQHGLANVDERGGDAKNRVMSLLASLEFPWK